MESLSLGLSLYLRFKNGDGKGTLKMTKRRWLNLLVLKGCCRKNKSGVQILINWYDSFLKKFVHCFSIPQSKVSLGLESLGSQKVNQ